jgi:hypothetical protein
MTPETSDSLTFLESLWPEVPDGMEILIWTLPDRRSYWCATVAAAALLVSQLSATKDVYTMVTLQPAGLQSNQRGEAKTASALCGLWLDLDIAGTGHSTKQYPPTAEDAMSVIYGEGLPSPTWLIHTGGGYHAWWLFAEPWLLEDSAERDRAQRLAEDWQGLFRMRAQSKGYAVDSTHDLARVLRVAGTFNRKIPGQPRPVAVADHSSSRLNPSDFEELLAEVASLNVAVAQPPQRASVVSIQSGQQQSGQQEGEWFINPQAEIKPHELRYLMNRFPNFWATWNQERQFRSGDRSASAYEMALANYGALADWPRQKIVDLLIHNRRALDKAGPKHHKYYTRTLAAAEDFARREGGDLVPPSATADNSGATNTAATSEPPSPSTAATKASKAAKPKTAVEEEVQWCREQLSKELGVDVLRLVKIGRDDPAYRLETADGDVHFASVEELASAVKFNHRMLIALDRVVGHYKEVEWKQFLGRLMKLVVKESIDQDAEIGGSTKVWLVAYLEDVDKHESWDTARLDKDNRSDPHIQDGALFVNCTHLCVWVRKNLNEAVTTKAMSGRLKLIGAEQVVRHINRPSTNISYWKLPPEDFDPADYLPLLTPAEVPEYTPTSEDLASLV